MKKEQFLKQNSVFSAINDMNQAVLYSKTPEELLNKACSAMLAHEDYCLIWVGTQPQGKEEIIPMAAVTSNQEKKMNCLTIIEQIFLEWDPNENPAVQCLITQKPIILRTSGFKNAPLKMQEIAQNTGISSYIAFPMLWDEKNPSVLNIFSKVSTSFNQNEIDFINNVATDISLALYSLKTTKRLKRESSLNQEIIETVKAILISTCHGGHILTFNTQAEIVTEYSRHEALNKFWIDLLIPNNNKQEILNIFTSIMKGHPNISNFHSEILCKDGQKKIINWHGAISPVLEESEIGCVLIGIDITEQLKADKELEKVRANWEKIFSAIQDPIMIVDKNCKIIQANLAALTASRKKQEEIINKGVCEVLHGEGRPYEIDCPLETLIRQNKSHILDTTLKGLNGDYLLTILPIPHQKNTLLIARDYSEEKVRKAEAMRAAQLASIGELAAGVAHEINNPINGIINYAQLILDEIEGTMIKNPVLKQMTKKIIQEGERIAGIVKNLLSFARQKEEILEDIFIKKLLEDSISLVKHQLEKNGIIIKIEIEKNLPFIKGNFQQLQQVILNLISNARYALNEKYPKWDQNKIIEISENKIHEKNEEVILIKVKDYGIGISQDIIERVIDPFFSTKPAGEGTGLGLSISHGIIKDHHGNLWLESKPDKDTIAYIKLPVDKKN